MVMAFCLAAMGLALVFFSQAPWLALAIVFLMIVNMFQVTFVTLNQTVLQATITDDMRGRVASLHMLEYGLIPAGAFAAGGAAEVIGAPNTISIMGGIVTLIAIVTILRARTLRQA
jgi:predicted MFS family arabinose efflux permease